MTKMAKGQRAVQRERLSNKVAELQASTGTTATDTSSGGNNLSNYTAIEFLERVVRDAEERRVFEDVAAVYDDLVDVGDSTLEIPKTTGHLSLSDQQSGASNEGTDRGYQQLENIDTVETTIDTNSFVSGGVKISKQAMMTTNIDLVEEARNAVTQQMAEDVDYAIRDEIESATSSSHTIDQTTSGELTPESIADAMAEIEKDNYTPRFLIVAPTHMNDLRKDSQFTNASEYGSDEVIMDGEIGQYLGLSVMKTQAAVQSDGDTYAYMVGEGPNGEAVGPLVAYKELPNMDMEFSREENAQKVYYDHAFETNTIQSDALALIQTSD